MKKKISLRLWLSIFFGGIRQFFINIFSQKNKTVFWRVIWAAVTLCLVILTGCILFEVYKDHHRRALWVVNDPLSSKTNFTRKEYSTEPGWISNSSTGEVITRDVDWVCVSEDEDSLAVFSSKGKRGYLNRYSGKVAIKPQYDKAWVFSSGVAAVAKDDRVFFIDHAGKPINDKTFAFNPRNNYLYHGDFCIMTDEYNLQGLIDREGNWKVEPKFEWIFPAPRNYWRMAEKDSERGPWYAYDDKGELINEEGVDNLEISDDLGIVYTLPNHFQMVVDFEGNKSESFMCAAVEPMYHDSEKCDSSGNFIPERCTLMRYRMSDGYEGLCRENGEIVTEPLYWTINPIGKDSYLCGYKNTSVGVIINSNGEITRTQKINS